MQTVSARTGSAGDAVSDGDAHLLTGFNRARFTNTAVRHSDTLRRANGNNRESKHAAPHMKTTVPPALLSDSPKLLKLARGLLGTMRLLKSRGTTDCTSTGELLAMQRFFKEFDDWIKVLDQQLKEKGGLRATLRERHQKHRDSKPHAQRIRCRLRR